MDTCGANTLDAATEKEVALLGLLSEEPAHAYRLEEKIRERHMTHWTAIGFSSIYRVLTKLEEQGLIDTSLEHGGQGATRKVYAINTAGRRRLADGVIRHLGVAGPPRSPFQVGVANVTNAPRAAVLEVLRTRLEHVAQVSQEIGVIERRALDAIEARAHDTPECAEPSGLQSKAAHRLCVTLLFDQVRGHLRAETAFLERALITVTEADAAAFFDPDAPDPDPDPQTAATDSAEHEVVT